MIKRLKCLLIVTLLFLGSTFAFAEILIHGLEDFNLGRWVVGAGSISADSALCVAISPQGPYQITVYGQGPGNEFVLSDAGVNVPIRMFYSDRQAADRAEELQPGRTLGGLRARRGNSVRRPCSRPNANISVLIAESDLTQLPAGRYQGNIVMIVGPE